MYTSGKTLNEVPYMQTRYLQLSFRFFSSQTILVFIYFVVQYSTAVSLFFNTGENADEAIWSQNRNSLTNEVNTIFRQNAELFGKAMFLTIYQGILAFLFLPSAVLQSKGSAALAVTTFVIKERSLGPVTRSRRKAIRKMKRGMVVGTFNELLVQAKPDVFCVEVALQSLHVAYEAYYDADGTPTLSGSGPTNLEVGGFYFVGCIYNSDVETFCLIGYHRETRKLVVSFRGSRVSQHWKSNLDYGKIDFDIENWTLPPEVDEGDGLDIHEGDAGGSGSGGSGGGGGTVISPLAAAGAGDEKDSNERRGSNHSVHSFHSAQELRDSDDASFFSANHYDEEDLDGWYDSSVDWNSDDDDDDEDDGGDGGKKRKKDHIPRHQRSTSGERGSSSAEFDRQPSMRETFIEPVMKPVSKATKATAKVVNAVTDTVGGLAISAARITPVLNTLVKEQVHKGFWEAYDKVRVELHTILRKQLKQEPAAKLVFTGHSLGGALATLASCDVAVHTMPRINEYHKMKSRQASSATGDSKDRIRVATACKLALYNFGSPKVGNGAFVRLFDAKIPDAFRVIVDGDIVPTMPPTGYSHVGTPIIIDGKGYGTIIIDPSIVERWLRPSNSGITTHFMDKYRAGLEGILVVHNAISSTSSAFTKAANASRRASLATPEHFDYRRALHNRMGETKALQDATRSAHSHDDGDGGDNCAVDAAGGESGETIVDRQRRKEETEGRQDQDKTKKLAFKMPLVNYAITQAYNLIYTRFDKHAQQRQMEETLNAESVPFRDPNSLSSARTPPMQEDK